MKKEQKTENDYRNDYRTVNITIEISMAKRRFSTPKLHIPRKNGKPDVSSGARWYVYFYWRTDPNGPLDKIFTIKKGINRLKTVEERKQVGNELAEGFLTALKNGWNPETKQKEKKTVHRKELMLGEALQYAFKIKSKTRKGPTIQGYEFHMNRFLEWARKEGYYGMDPKNFKVDHFHQFMDWLRFDYVNEKTGEGLSGSSVNNHKASLSALFTAMKNERLVDYNFIRDIPKVDSEPVNNKAFTPEDLKRIKEALLKEDPYLVYFISFMIYPLLRPREICRLKVQDLNLEKGYLSVETKTDILSVRRIIQKMEPTIEAMKLKGVPGHYHLFSHMNRPREWDDVKLKSRVDHFGKRFNKIKTKLGFGREYTLYSIRHTAIMNLYDSLIGQGMGEQEILFKLMPITQHRSIGGIKAYLRRHRQSIPPDHSDIYTIDF